MSKALKTAPHAEKSAIAKKKGIMHVPKTVLLPFLRQMRTLKTARLEAKIPAGWFSVSKDTKSDDKDVESYYLTQLSALRAVAKSAIGSSHIKTKLFYEINTAGSSSTAYATAVGVTPDSSGEFAALSGLYDEYKVLGGKVRFQILNSQGTPNVVSVWAAMGFDSTYSTTPTSVVEVLESSQSRLFGTPPSVVNNSYSPQTAAKDGFYEFDFRIPSQSVANGVAVTGGTGIIANFPGEWTAVNSTAGTSAGFLRTYVQSPGSGNTITFRAIVELHVEWRERT